MEHELQAGLSLIESYLQERDVDISAAKSGFLPLPRRHKSGLKQETYRHFYQLTTQHLEHPLSRLFLTRTWSLLHPASTSPEAQVPSHAYWESDLTCAPWLLSSPSANTDAPELRRRMNGASFVAAQLTQVIYIVRIDNALTLLLIGPYGIWAPRLHLLFRSQGYHS